jgi:hypothetical protein
MKSATCLLTALLLLDLALPAAAQTKKKADTFPTSAEARAQKRCQENRGTDCSSREGLREWVLQEKPVTKEQQQAAAAARRHRQECARNKNKSGC